MSYAKKNLNDVEDSAPKFGFAEHLEARFARNDLGAQTIGVALESYKPGKRSAFGHSHESDEEIYVVIRGSGRMKIGDDIVDIGPLDAVRVAPDIMRAFEAGDDGLDVIAFGTHTEGDQGEIKPDFWSD